MQNYEIVKSIGQRMEFTCNCFIGGLDGSSNVESLKGGCQIAVGTPGRILHMIETNKLKCDQLAMVVVEDPDEMRNRGFAEQLIKIFKYAPKNVQVILVS